MIPQSLSYLSLAEEEEEEEEEEEVLQSYYM
jgi:hypothetical protein